MTVFGRYAEYYDLLYRRKDYAGESRHIDRMIRSLCPAAATILNLGCGTGGHDRHLARMGYTVMGVDRSAGMVAAARKSAACDPALTYSVGDIRCVRLGQTFDAVVALFHVMSYLTRDGDLQDAFQTAALHLAPSGVFLFDCWHGPGVLAIRPEARVQEFEAEGIRVVRMSRPAMHPEEHTVAVNYRMRVRRQGDEAAEEFRETHRMRYFFKPELERAAAGAGLRIVAAEEWMSGRPLDEKVWSAFFIARRM